MCDATNKDYMLQKCLVCSNRINESVYVFMTHILAELKKGHSAIDEVDICSDGASSQFKQRFLFSNLSLWEDLLQVKLRWHFSATSHGKGVVDGLGGTIKRAVWRHIRSERGFSSTPEQFFELARDRNPGITINQLHRGPNRF